MKKLIPNPYEDRVEFYSDHIATFRREARARIGASKVPASTTKFTDDESDFDQFEVPMGRRRDRR